MIVEIEEAWELLTNNEISLLAWRKSDVNNILEILEDLKTDAYPIYNIIIKKKVIHIAEYDKAKIVYRNGLTFRKNEIIDIEKRDDVLIFNMKNKVVAVKVNEYSLMSH